MFLILILFAIIFIITLFYFKRKHYVDLGDKFPGPRTIPLLGNGHLFINKNAEGIFQKMLQLHSKYGESFRLWFGPELWVIESNPKQVEGILTSPKIIYKSSDYKFLVPWLGKGLLVSTGSKWFKRRKIITPAFHFKILEQFIEIFDSQSNVLIENLQKIPKDEVISIGEHLKLFALDVICETAMGTKINAQIDRDTEYLKAVQKAADIIFCRIFDPLAQNDLYFSMTRNARILQKKIKILHDFTEEIIVKRRDELITTKSLEPKANLNFDEFGPKKKMALLDILLQSTIDGKPLTNDDVREEVDTFMFAGHDTTTSAMSFVLYCLAKYQDVQQKVYNEIIEVAGSDKKKLITMRHLNSLKYLDLVIKESFRVFPPVPYIGRHLTEDTNINGVIYPANANISIAVCLMHMNPDIFHDPEEFIPERFDEERTTDKINAFSFIPFSGGNRNCIGQKFALLEIKVVMCKMLRNFRIRLADENEKLVLLSELVLQSKTGIKVLIAPRD